MQTGRIMKNIYKSFALLCMGLAATACIEENFENSNKIEVVPGNEIMFTATAQIQDGDMKTRTEYGDINASGENGHLTGHVEINWVTGDNIAITSEQTAGAEVATYSVAPSATTSGQYAEKHSAASLTRKGDAGLQWTDETDYVFYAAYPSFDYDSDLSHGAEAKLNRKGVFSGNMPIEQKYKSVDPARDAKNHNGWKIAPEMKYAFMTAKATYNVEQAEAIQLNFNSIVTALQFDITANTIKIPGSSINTIEIMSVSLISKSKNISGDFAYDIVSDEYASGDKGYNRVTIHFEDPISIAKDEFLDVTFFILPEDIPANDLQLQVLFKIGDSQQSKTATIAKPLSGGKKYCFNDLLLPTFEGEVSSSSWFDTLDPNALMSQVSIPVASNVFAAEKYGVQEKSRQQVLDYTDLWSRGVRGFELVTRKSMVNNATTLDKAHFVTDEVPFVSDEMNFGEAFVTLAEKLSQNPKEVLVLFCTYQAIQDGYTPDQYVSQLINYLDNFVKTNEFGFTDKDFVQITSQTTVGQAQGNICIIIRPGDDDRYETKNYTSEISLGDWADNLLLVQDWGTAFDVWDRRYEGEIARESTFETLYVVDKAKKRTKARTQIEDWLWAEGTNGTTTPTTFKDALTMPDKRETFNFTHALTGITNGNAFVQEWARVANGEIKQFAVQGATSRKYFWVYWPDSFEEKKKAIYDLFTLSVDERGEQASNNIYINSLSGYFIDKSVAVEGLYPFKHQFDGFYRDGWLVDWNDITDQGKGGDHPGLAYELNKYVYDILSGENMHGMAPLDEGPWGYVMMEHIGNTVKGTDDKSLKLVDLIMMNNFKFPMATKVPGGQKPEETTYNATYSNGGEAISFK